MNPEPCRACANGTYHFHCAFHSDREAITSSQRRGDKGEPLRLCVDCATVHSPSHYQAGEMQTIDVIEAFGLGFHLGNVVKYVLRAGRKDAAIQDLQKAKWYLEREIERRQ